jgi:hypothetical protein
MPTHLDAALVPPAEIEKRFAGHRAQQYHDVWLLDCTVDGTSARASASVSTRIDGCGAGARRHWPGRALSLLFERTPRSEAFTLDNVFLERGLLALFR